MDMQQAIAEVLSKHQKGFFGDQYGNCAACACDWKGAGWADHAAEMVVTELGLQVGYDPARDCLVIAYRETPGDLT